MTINDLSAEQMKDVFGEAWDLLSPQDQEKIRDIMSKSQKNINSTGQPSKEEIKTINNIFANALLQTLKTGTEASLEHLTKLIGPEANLKLRELIGHPDKLAILNVKTYIASKGLGITFLFNIGLSSLDGEKELFKKATAATASDLIIGISIKLASGAASGAVNWSFLGLSLFDSLTYDQQTVDSWFNDAWQLRSEANKLSQENNYLAAMGLRLAAQGHDEAASQALFLHDVAGIGTKVTNTIYSLFSKESKLPEARPAATTGLKH